MPMCIHSAHADKLLFTVLLTNLSFVSLMLQDPAGEPRRVEGKKNIFLSYTGMLPQHPKLSDLESNITFFESQLGGGWWNLK